MKYILFFIISIVMCYAVDLAPRYVALLSSGNLQFIGSIQQFRQPCTRESAGDMKCADSYRIPAREVSGTASVRSAVGLGMFISSTEIYCSNADTRRLRFGDPKSGSRALELLKTYQTVDLSEIDCAGDLIVDVWNPSSYRRSGYVGEP